MRISRVALAALLTTALVIPGLASAPAASAAEPEAAAFTSIGAATTGTTYYVDGGSGDDSAAGTSPTTAWRSLTKVSSVTFQPGDRILLESGSTWNGQMLHPKGSGTAADPIAIDLYTNDHGSAVYSADRRPTVNGDGTYGTGSFKRYITGAVQLVNQEYWQIQNLEVTNSPEASDPEGYKKPGDAQRAGILVMGYEQDRTFNSIRVANNYVHDVQSEYFQQPGLPPASQGPALKATGGIIVLGHWVDPDGTVLLPAGEWRSSTGFHDVTIERNIVKRVGLEGIRTKADANTAVSNSFKKTMSDIRIVDNYLEDVAGDAIVLSEVAGGGLVEGNIAVRPANADYGARNFAGVWSMSNNDAVFQYNEVYGTRFGYNDAEAYDIDLGCVNVVYQYNYSHHNAGGFMLLMSDQKDSVVRYNISANDGGGNRGTNADKGGGGGYTYKEQSIFHYWVKNEGSAMPQIYNNTLYVGDGVSTALFGEGNSGDNSGTNAYFRNNILVKEGSGSLKFLTAHPSDGKDPIERALGAPDKLMKNNVFWPVGLASSASGVDVADMEAAGNLFADPRLAIQGDPALAARLAEQATTTFDDRTDRIEAFTSRERLRERASLFQLTSASPAVMAGTAITGGASEDFFGTNTAGVGLDIGAHQLSQVKTVSTLVLPEISVRTAAGVYPRLPDTIEVTVRETAGTSTSERTEQRPVTWNPIPAEDYRGAGAITATGTVGGTPSAAIEAAVTVVGELGDGTAQAESVALDAAFVQRGSGGTAMGAQAGTSTAPSAAEAYKFPFGVSMSNNLVLKLKNAASAAYNRRIYVSFDPAGYEGDLQAVKSAVIRLYVSRYDAWTGAGGSDAERLRNTAFAADVYATAPTWSSSTLTWNNAPLGADISAYAHADYGAGEGVPSYEHLVPVAHQAFTNGQIIDNGDAIDLDVADYIRSLPADSGPVSFAIDIPASVIPNYNRDNSGFDAFSILGAKQAFADYQAGRLTLPAGLPEGFEMSETALAPSLRLSEVYLSGISPVEAEVAPGEVPDLPDTVTLTYSDGKTAQAAVTWPEITADQLQTEGEHTVLGRIPGVSAPVVAVVRVVALHVTGFAELSAMDLPVGLARSELGMPGTVTAALDDGSTVDLVVTGWDDDPRSYGPTSPPDTYRFPGGVQLPSGVTNPDELRPEQVVTTHPRPESITLSTPRTELSPGSTARIGLTVTGAAPYPDTDAWGQAVAWTVEASAGTGMRALAAAAAPTVDDEGLLEIGADAAPGRYTITATSTRVDGVAGSIDITVLAEGEEPGEEPGGDPGDGGTGGVEGGGTGGATTGTGGSALASTGADGAAWVAIGLIALLTAAAGALMVVRRRRDGGAGVR